jgi:hypothetical protein
MTTYTDFAPAPRRPFRWQLTLDGGLYAGVIYWNVSGQRWFVSIKTTSGALIVARALIASPDALPTASLTWDGVRRRATVTTPTPHGQRIGSVVEMTISRVSPAFYNGVQLLTVRSPFVMDYPLPVDPGTPALVQGFVGYDLNLLGSYFKVSTLVFRESSQQLEVAP